VKCFVFAVICMVCLIFCYSRCGNANRPVDGGVQMHVFINNQYKCSSKASYGTRSASEGGMSHGTQDKDGSIKTISGMSTCWGDWQVKKGDYLTGVAEYDLKKH